MSKMRMPEMSVVRFEESDVICASSRYIPQTMRLAGFRDAERTNGMLTFDGTDYIYGSYGNYGKIVDTFLFNSDYSTYRIGWENVPDCANGSVSFSSLTDNEGNSPAASNGAPDGEYQWNGTNQFDWVKQ